MDKLFDKNTSKEFLLVEYQECFDQMRHYDSIEINFVKFCVSSYIALIAGSFALHQYLQGTSKDIPYVAFILLAGSIAGLLLLAFAVRNRAYFVVVARQVNTIRKYFLENSETNFIEYNKCYLNPQKPDNFNWKSTYAYLIVLLIFSNSLLLFGASFFLIKYIFLPSFHFGHLLLCIVAFLMLAGIQYLFSIRYLRNREGKHADESIF